MEPISPPILIGVGGIIIGVLLYFARVQREERRAKVEEVRQLKRAKEQAKALESRQRCDRVRDEYLRNARRHYVDGLPGLMIAGICSLQNEIETSGQRSPLGSEQATIAAYGYHKFFSEARRRRFDFLSRGSPKEVIEGEKE
jgi:hypothetical protein